MVEALMEVAGDGGRVCKFQSRMDRVSSQLVEDSTLLPEQFFGEIHRMARVGEKGLMLAILADAVDCLSKYSYISTRRGRRLFEEAYDWIVDEDEEYLFSAANICMALSLEHSVVRSFVEKRYGIARYGGK